MKDEYDFSKMRCIKNPYAKMLKQQVTINIFEETLEFFEEESRRIGLPYQTLINFYINDCVSNERKLSINWD